MIGLVAAIVLIAEILLIIFLPTIGYGLLALLGIILLVAILIPVGVHASYLASELIVRLKIACFEFKVYPRKKEEPKPEKPNNKPTKTKAKSEDKPKKKLKFSFEEILELLKKAINALGKFGKFTVHKFMLHYIAAGSDPYKTAMTFGQVNAALSSLAPLCAKKLRVKEDVDVWTDVDFVAEKTSLELELSVSLRIVQLLRVAVVLAWGALWVFVKNKRRLSKEAKQLNADKSNNEKIELNTKINTEERM